MLIEDGRIAAMGDAATTKIPDGTKTIDLTDRTLIPGLVATSNGAEFLGELDKIGTLAPGKAADIVVLQGDPSANIKDIEKVEIVFKDGVGYDSAKLIESVRGQVGLH